MDDCNQFKGFFKGGEHYIEAEGINEDGTINRQYMFNRPKGLNTDCSPTKKTIESVTRKRPIF